MRNGRSALASVRPDWTLVKWRVPRSCGRREGPTHHSALPPVALAPDQSVAVRPHRRLLGRGLRQHEELPHRPASCPPVVCKLTRSF